MSITLDRARAVVKAVTCDVWNSPSKEVRMRLFEEYCAKDFVSYPPDGSVTHGYEECDAAYEGLHADGRQDWKFAADGDLWIGANCIMQAWTFGGEQGWKGWDIVIVDEQDKVKALYGMVQGMHNHKQG